MRNLNLEEEIRRSAEEALEIGFRLYDFVLVYGKSILKIKIFLDKLNDPWGTPTIAECGRFARACDSRLMDLVNMGKMTEDYVLEVSSPGAERELKGREEWVRFQDKPMKVRYNITPAKFETKILFFIKVEGDVTYWKKARLKRDKKGNTKNKIDEEVNIFLKDVNQVRLYLDF